MKNRHKIRPWFFFLFILFSFSVYSQTPKQMKEVNNTLQSYAYTKITAHIIDGIIARETGFLNFGVISPGSSKGGSVVVTPKGEQIVCGEIVVHKNTSSPANFHVSGGRNFAYSLLLPNKPVVLTNYKDLSTLTVSDWKADVLLNPKAGRDIHIIQKLGIGARLNINNLKKNAFGVYQGFYDITFMYN